MSNDSIFTSLLSTWKKSTLRKILYNIFREIHISFLYIIPNAIKWLYLTTITKKITHYPIHITNEGKTKTASLYLYNKDSLNKNYSEALLFGHADFSNAYTLLPLAQIADKELGCPIFFLNLPSGDYNHNTTSQLLVDKAIEKTYSLADKKNGTFKGIILAGHSKGAIWSAYHAFAKNDQRISKVITIAGRLKDGMTKLGNPVNEQLRPIIQATYHALITQNRNIPLHQIVPENDWLLPQECMIVRKENVHIIPNSSHLSVLYNPQTYIVFKKILTNKI